MKESHPRVPETKQHHALNKLVGAVVVAGAIYAADKFIESRRKKSSKAKE